MERDIPRLQKLRKEAETEVIMLRLLIALGDKSKKAQDALTKWEAMLEMTDNLIAGMDLDEALKIMAERFDLGDLLMSKEEVELCMSHLPN